MTEGIDDNLAPSSPDRPRELAPLLAHPYYAAEAWPLASEYAPRAAAAHDLPHSLGASFAQSAVVRRAERS